MQWGQAEIEKLTRLWRSGLSSSEIARVMGLSRSAVMGKAKRLGLLGSTPEDRSKRIKNVWLLKRLKRRRFNVVPGGSAT